MSAGFNPNWIIGKTIAKVDMQPEPAREDGNTIAHNPIITFTDGSWITFTAEETDFGRYGVDISYWKSTKRSRP